MPATLPIALEDLAALRWAMEPAVHPSEPLVAYVVSGPDRQTDRLRYELFAMEVGGETRLHQRDARGPRWSPRGDLIAFAEKEDDRWVPACRSLSGESWNLRSIPGDLFDLRWATDGTRLLAMTATPTQPAPVDQPRLVSSSADFEINVRKRAWILEPDTEPVPVGEDIGNILSATWAPDGSQVALVSDKGVDPDTGTAAGLWLWNLADGDSKCLVSPVVPIHAVDWSPDGLSIAYLAAARDNKNSALSELWVADVGSGTTRQLGSGLDRSVGKAVRGDDERGVGAPILQWSTDSASLMAVYAEGGRSRLARFGVDDQTGDILADETCVLEFSSGQAGTAFSWSDPHTPGEVSWLDAATGAITQLTRLAEDSLAGVELMPTIEVSVVASDGVTVEGWLTLPEGFPDPPLVLQVHGGPHYAIGGRFSFDSQRLAAQGIAVLRANPRGSQGYGQAFADGNLGDWGGRDFDDLIELVDEVVRAAAVDSHRVGIMGESYGGYMAAWAAGTSDRFSAVVVENGIADFFSSAGGSIGPTFWHAELGGAPWENQSLYMERSPITRLNRVKAPVLVIHCEQDTTCPIANGEAIHAALRDLGRDVEFLRVPGEGHFFNVFGALSRRLRRTEILDEFLVRHLLAGVPKSDTKESTP